MPRRPQLRAISRVLVLLAWIQAAPGSGADLFVRGDTDGSGSLGLTDAVRVFQLLFQGLPASVTCRKAADADDDGALTITDGVVILSSLFRGGPRLAAPFPVCGRDPTDDALGCAAYEACPPGSPFYGVELSARAVVYVVDRSGTLQDTGALARAKEEIIASLRGLPADTEFGVVFFARDVVAFPTTGLLSAGSPEAMASAEAFIGSVRGSAGSCVLEGLTKGLELASSATSSMRLIAYVGDGGGTCKGSDELNYFLRALRTVAELNRDVTATIDVFEVLQAAPLGEDFLRDLVQQNGGRYTRVSR